MDYTIYVVKTKALISCRVSFQLICAIVFTYVKGRFSYDEAHVSRTLSGNHCDVIKAIRHMTLSKENQFRIVNMSNSTDQPVRSAQSNQFLCCFLLTQNHISGVFFGNVDSD